MKKKSPLGEITPSICEAAFERYTSLDDSVAEMIKKNCVEVRDFIILSFVYDQNELDVRQIARILGLSRTKTRVCVDRLIEANLVEYTDTQSTDSSPIRLTQTGQQVTLRVHSV